MPNHALTSNASLSVNFPRAIIASFFPFDTIRGSGYSPARNDDETSRTGKEGDVSNRERILVVDEVADTAEVLQAVLAPRGLTVNRVRRLDQTVSPAGESRPAVMVLDAESFGTTSIVPGAQWQDVPQVIIGTVRFTQATTAESTDSDRRYLQKPFQFAELVQAIEALISRSREM
jgi:DNA-binding NtrC family response regulator